MADQGTEGLLSPFLRKQRFHAAMPYLCGRVLDVGCGSGALAKSIHPQSYIGVEVDQISLRKAQACFPLHAFQDKLPPEHEKFDTVVSLAVIEHVCDPGSFLESLARFLRDDRARIILTTPHPSVDWVHSVGAFFGLFSKHASEQHECLMTKESLERHSMAAKLSLVSYERFLLGANQLIVLKRNMEK